MVFLLAHKTTKKLCHYFQESRGLSRWTNLCAVSVSTKCLASVHPCPSCNTLPMFILYFRSICVLPTHDVGRERHLTLLGALHTVDQKFGYRFLFFLKARLGNCLFHILYPWFLLGFCLVSAWFLLVVSLVLIDT